MKVTYQDVKSKEGENVKWKPIEMLDVTLLEDSKNKNETLLPIDEFVWRTRREDEQSKNKTLMLIDKFVWRTQREGKLSNNKTLMPIDEFIWRTKREQER